MDPKRIVEAVLLEHTLNEDERVQPGDGAHAALHLLRRHLDEVAVLLLGGEGVLAPRGDPRVGLG